ncbi:hypothetical protein ACFXPX_36715 [Kitasatospora sp. NPDC059146]|uniref:hypothetical protein n=1 Tax=unclassified Kitasatospora TaxID=2633591 RepID=UPI0036BC52A3
MSTLDRTKYPLTRDYPPMVGDHERPTIDKTATSVHGYRIGKPVGPGYGHGTLYSAVPDKADGIIRTVTRGALPADDDNARMLREFLNGPRRVHFSIYLPAPFGEPWTETRLMTSHETVVTGAPNPQDYLVWTAWTEEYGRQWLADAFPAGIPSGSYNLYASSPDIACLSGGGGQWSLSRSVELFNPAS